MALALKSCNKIFGGLQKVFTHKSSELECDMNFGVFLPSNAETTKCPVIYWLSGLTCTEQNFITKAGAQRYAEENRVILVAPDTSPRGCGIQGEDDSWDFGSGAGFYVDATQDPWKTNYRMYSYVTKELPQIVNNSFPVNGKQSIMGHSMGGHGALVCALKNPQAYCSASAFAPICNPRECPWGVKAFTGYLGSDRTCWDQYDATVLARKFTTTTTLPIRVDQGADDEFYKNGQLLPENLVAACRESNINLQFNLHDSYDHSYFYISTFIREHIRMHAAAMK